MINLAFVDGTLSPGEEQLITKIATLFHVSSQELHSMMGRFEGMFSNVTTQSSLDEAYKLLEISSDASLENIKKAYRKKVRENHPDLIKAQGKSDAYIEEATQKVQQINAAYERIKKSKKM